MVKHRGCRYRIYPNIAQSELIIKTIGHSRFVYNRMLDESKTAYEQGGRFTSRNAFNYRLTSLKDEYPWLREVDATALTSANDALAAAFNRFFKKQNAFPNFHKKKSFGSYISKCVNGNICIKGKHIKLPKIGKVKAVIHREPSADWKIKSAAVSQNSDGKFYVSLLFEYDEAIAAVPVSDNIIGLDYASDGLYVDDKGNIGSNHKYYREAHDKLAKEQRKLSRKAGSKKNEPKSSNWHKQLKKVNRLHAHIKNQRRDNLHKISAEIANQYDVVCVESLNMRSMSNKGFGNGKATLDNGYGMFLNFLEYKLQDRGKYFVKVDKWFPSSQICHQCGTIHKKMKDLSIRTMKCDCGLTISRDQNAAINIKNEGLRILKSA